MKKTLKGYCRAGNMIRKILISQSTPMDLTPYAALSEKFGIQIDFKPFFVIEPLSSREFRTQRLNILDYTAIVFSARHTIDAFFQLCEELRITVPETMKYFCTSEKVAMYLQKHIVYRKRKIFYGQGTPDSLMAAIGPKHKDEKFLITTSATPSEIHALDGSSDSEGKPFAAPADAISMRFQAAGLDFTTAAFVKPVSQDLKEAGIDGYDMAVVYNPADVKSLQENFPDIEGLNLKFVTYGKQIVKAMKEADLPVEVQAPTPEAPSVAKALEMYLAQMA